MNMKKFLFGLIIVLCISNIGSVWYYEHREYESVGYLKDTIRHQIFYIDKLKRERDENKDYKEALILQLKGLRNDNRSGDVCPACGNDSSIAIMTCWGCFPPKNPYLDSCVWKLYRNHIRIYRLPEERIGTNIPGENAKRFLCSDCGYKWGKYRPFTYYLSKDSVLLCK